MPKPLLRALFAVVATVVVVAGIFLARRTVPLEAATVEFQYADDAVNPMWIRVDPNDGREREITISWGRLETTIIDDGNSEHAYFFERGLGRLGPVTVQVSDETELVFGSGLVESEESTDLGDIVWDQVGPDRYSAEATPATDSAPARGIVDESYSWGLFVEGLGLRATPEFETERSGGVVQHEQEFDIICWTEGDPITNGSDGELADDTTQFSSELWWKIDGPEGEGFISNTWFARVETAESLNAPRC